MTAQARRQEQREPARERYAFPLAIAVSVATLLGSYPVGKNGMRAAYFSTIDWTGPSVTRIDPFPFPSVPDLALNPVPPKGFSAHWIGTLVVDRAGIYQLRIICTGCWCLLALDNALQVDSRVRGVPEAFFEIGAHTFSVSCSTTSPVLNVGIWWDRAGIDDPQRMTSEIVFPNPITLREYKRVTLIARVQWILMVFAAVGATLVVMLWAHGRGAIGWASVLVMSAVTAAIHFNWVSWLRGPEEWRWGYWQRSVQRPAFAAIAFGLTVLAAMGLAGSRLAARAPRTASLVLLAMGLVGGFGFQLALLDIDARGWQQLIVDRAADDLGYLAAAAKASRLPMSEFIRAYPKLMPTLSLRASTHPPGGTIMYGALLRASERHTLGFERFAFGRSQNPTGPLGMVALEGGLIWAASATLTALPVALIGWTLTRNVLVASTVGLLWLFCPGPTFFVPWLDQLDTLLVACSFALLLFAQVVSQRQAVWSVLSGVIAGVALFFSYGTAPMLGTALVMSGYRIDSAAGRRTYLLTGICWVGGLVIAVFAPAIFGYPVISTVLSAWEPHRRLTLTRHYTTWLFFNLLDFAMMFGAASLVIVVATLTKGPRRAAARRLTACVVGAVLLTNLSGTTRGEVGRLWMPFMPLLFAAAWSAPIWSGKKTAPHLESWDAVVLGAMAILYCMALRLHWVVW